MFAAYNHFPMHHPSIKMPTSNVAKGTSILKGIKNSNNVIVDFKWIYTSPASEAILNECYELSQARSLFETVPMSQKCKERLTAVLEIGEGFEHDVFAKKSGKWLSICYERYEDNIIMSIEDTTNNMWTDRWKVSEHRFDTLFENNGVGIGLVDDSGLYIKVNRKLADMFGYTIEDFKGRKVQEFYYEREKSVSYNLHAQLKNREIKSYEVERQYLRKDGSVFWGLLTVSLYEDEGERINAIGILQDIDAKKKGEEHRDNLYHKLQETDENKDKLLSILVHDLRDPVSSMMQFLYFLLDDFEQLSKEQIAAYLKLVHNKSMNLYELLEELLLWIQNQFKNVSFTPEELTLKVAVAKAIDRINYRVVDKNITIQTDVENVVSVKADKNMLSAILRNLLSNAVKFSHENGIVLVQARQEGESVTISISDQGMGMHDDMIGKILAGAFVRSSYGTKGEKGVGLGLGLCNSFIEKHGGKLTIDSRVGKGSIFSFQLPATLQMLYTSI